MEKTSTTLMSAALSLFFCHAFLPCAYAQSLVFGPELFSTETDNVQRFVRTFSVQDVGQDYVFSVQSGEGREKAAGSVTVNINGKRVVSLRELGRQFRALTKPVKLQKQNEISVEVTGLTDAPIVVTIMGTGEHTVASKVPPIGGVVDLEGYASVIFPAGTFDVTQDVTISATASAATRDIFEANATGPRLPYEIRINTGGNAPGKDIEVSLNFPASFFEPPIQIHVFAQMLDDPVAPGGHDRFFMVRSGLDDKIFMAMASLPRHAFSNRYGKNGTYEAIVTVGLTH